MLSVSFTHDSHTKMQPFVDFCVSDFFLKFLLTKTNFLWNNTPLLFPLKKMFKKEDRTELKW